ncbi:MAG: hypothetical protein JO301_17025 [Chitinophagaceae bacterium]|nr:hypothetical protein [Chitinophagaceae bacterium]
MGALDVRRDFFEDLASQNKLVAHGQPVAEGSDELRVSFISVEDPEGLPAAVETGIHFPCVVILDLKGKLNDKGGSIRRQWNNVLWFLHKDNTGATENQKKQTAYDTAETVMNQFISKMQNLLEEDGSCGPFKDLHLESFFFEMTGRVSDGLYGWRLSFSDENAARDITIFDSSKWTEEE